MVRSEQIKMEDIVGIRFSYESKEYEILFNTREKAGGHITIKENSKIIIDKNFTETVILQKRLY